MSLFDKIKEKGKEFISQTKEQIQESELINSVSEKFDRLNNNLEKISKDSDFYKQEIVKVTDSVPKEIERLNNNLDKITKEDIEYFKQSTQALKIILMIIAVLLLVLIVVLLVR